MNIAEPHGRQTALMWAAAEGHADVVSELIALGATVVDNRKTSAFSVGGGDEVSCCARFVNP